MKWLTYILVLLSIPSCEQDLRCLCNESLSLSIETAIHSKAMNKRFFTENDTIDLYQWTKNDNIERGDFVLKGGYWNNISKLQWQSIEEPHYFLATSPKKDIYFDNNGNAHLDYSIEKDSSLLFARVLTPGRKATDGSVPLSFGYLASKLTVVLNFGSTFTDNPRVLSLKLKNIAHQAEKLYLTSGDIYGELSDFRDVELYSTEANNSYTAYIIPQEIGDFELIVNSEGKKLVYTKSVTIYMKSGSEHTLEFDVN